MSWLLKVGLGGFGCLFVFLGSRGSVISLTYFFSRASCLSDFGPHRTVRWEMNTYGREIKPLIPQDVFSDTSRSQFDRKNRLEKETI